MKKILASDYDGTFYLNEKNIKENVKEVKDFRKKGNIFMIATGNNYENFIKTVNKYHIEYDYLILDDGGMIIDNKNNVISANFIDSDIVKEISCIIKKECGNIAIFNQWKEIDDGRKTKITKISTKIKDVKIAKKFAKKINKLYKNYIHAYTMIFKDMNIVEIISNKIDKKEAIKKISNIEKVKNSNVYVVGDGYNDLNMIKYFNGYCMRNSVSELLEACKNQVTSVSNLIESIVNC